MKNLKFEKKSTLSAPAFFPIPLFLQGLSIWGTVMASLWALGFIIPDGNETFLLSVIGIALSIFLGLKGNEILAKNYLKYGWKFVDPEDDIVKIAKRQWGIRSE